MILLTALWGLGYAALLVATIAHGIQLYTRWFAHRPGKAVEWTAQTLLAVSTVTLWLALIYRAVKGHGWPFHSPADLATGMALLILPLYVAWSALTRQAEAGFAVSLMVLTLLSYGLISQPPTFSAIPFPSPGSRIGTLLNLGGGAFLALAAATSLTSLARAAAGGNRSPGAERQPTDLSGAETSSLSEDESRDSVEAQTNSRAEDLASEAFARGALFCLAISLAIDTWWLQKVGLGNVNDAQQAGIAVVWIVYFVAIRLRSHPNWKGWPWTAILSVGFCCTLPILLNMPWLETSLPL